MRKVNKKFLPENIRANVKRQKLTNQKFVKMTVSEYNNFSPNMIRFYTLGSYKNFVYGILK